jgi:3-hydroxyisobutyrate dehydrogenase-like beta-hydroxyacid dehydrogenase
MSSTKATFIGLGTMGYPMAGHLAKAGHQTAVFNRTGEKAKAWAAAFGGRVGATPADAALEADVVFTCVGNDDDLRGVLLGDQGAFGGMKAGSILVDHTTASADAARELGAAALEKGLHFLDAPVSGGQVGAENGALTVMVGGDEDVFARAEPIIAAYAKAITLMGPVGAGQLTKMVNQICVAGLLQSLAEGLSFAVQAGLDARRVVDAISKGAVQSWQMDNRYDTMLNDQFDFGFAVDWMRKDLGICLAEARNNGSPLPVAEIVDGYFAQLQKRGGGRSDISSLIRLLAK